ncbi:4Fe-4S dicluster domain-containing protein [Desulfocurvus sp.]|jgi:formate dehydrogenase subunit beta|uniref:4Fe-4S dicluster domain-containing protein n=1 Tax=Desulfocurvus sp. TaxID=2871698 RepID=UPI0025BDF441|nr:4Fe-4S dicluster domain-containing protein [Desulfocurvus sp.]MCK9239214.1 4Fe-4S binding protein [Desulfocurvus sp.]
MATIARIDIDETGPVRAVQGFLKTLLARGGVDAVLTPAHLVPAGTVMPTLISDPEALERADPLSPAFPLNAARLVSRLTRGSTSGRHVAAVLRPCEIRAFIELVKLNQGGLDNVLLIGLDCPGAMTNADFRVFGLEGDPLERTREFLRAVAGGESRPGGRSLAGACRVCEHPAPEGADLILGLHGADLDRAIPVLGNTARGEGVLTRLGLPDAPGAPGRREALDALTARNTAARDAMFEATAARTASLAGLAEYLSGCVNCYNCRVACPVCYCKECVFLTDVFDYKPDQYLGWARKRGAIKLPADTVFFHLTRLAHMSTACVGCGQCSNACPNDVPVMELFRTVAERTQGAFGYQPGRSPDEAPPMTVFREDEFSEMTGEAH